MCIFPHRKTLSKEVFSLEVAVTIEVTLPISGGRQHTLKISTTLNVEAEGSQDNHLSAVVWTKLSPYRVRYSNTGFGWWCCLGDGMTLWRKDITGGWIWGAHSLPQLSVHSIIHLRLKNIFHLPDWTVSCHVSPTIMNSPCKTGRKKKSLPFKTCLDCGHLSQYHSSRKVNNTLGYRSSRTTWAT